ncbi:hypothetical protein LMG26857_03386 [Achromobacter anxifer]|uniref:hypothetical protein n=1 Tax=Achromobacter anxifer TaxID=1287737 RepID=UPI00155C8707|nr:hypothetical protein [Achromobacter anxifer]CAB5514327.1 hypothetical protein LMG26857_03386 [Achromobacter anxifer]
MAELTKLSDYLDARKRMIAAREAFFGALKMYLGAEQRPEAGDLDEPLWNHAARRIKGQDWVMNETRGYLVLKEDPSSRPFRLTVDQPGHLLVITLSLVPKTPLSAGQDPFSLVQASLRDLGIGTGHQTKLEAADDQHGHRRHYCRWQIIMPELYTDPRSFEQAHHIVWRVFDAAVVHLSRT